MGHNGSPQGAINGQMVAICASLSLKMSAKKVPPLKLAR